MSIRVKEPPRSISSRMAPCISLDSMIPSPTCFLDMTRSQGARACMPSSVDASSRLIKPATIGDVTKTVGRPMAGSTNLCRSSSTKSSHTRMHSSYESLRRLFHLKHQFATGRPPDPFLQQRPPNRHMYPIRQQGPKPASAHHTPAAYLGHYGLPHVLMLHQARTPQQTRSANAVPTRAGTQASRLSTDPTCRVMSRKRRASTMSSTSLAPTRRLQAMVPGRIRDGTASQARRRGRRACRCMNEGKVCDAAFRPELGCESKCQSWRRMREGV
ncbi:hypothetical protein BCR44DRAFT_1441442 [Catenaria anguillulae PL171]|uniref:Uncharacterized protein n=1 Tax=Catenaria anguillulae PL171 TaxID=765915 RepID=A0A1Y2HB67_9FUNG|nr:hypothetical protein BCR44DRAFT_1441442 [Catenaria anguillulae PL171]